MIVETGYLSGLMNGDNFRLFVEKNPGDKRSIREIAIDILSALVKNGQTVRDAELFTKEQGLALIAYIEYA